MPLITRSIPNLIGGVSQQPEILRLENQATAQENGFSGVVEGLKKRPPTNHVAKISSSSIALSCNHSLKSHFGLIANIRSHILITESGNEIESTSPEPCSSGACLSFIMQTLTKRVDELFS